MGGRASWAKLWARPPAYARRLARRKLQGADCVAAASMAHWQGCWLVAIMSRSKDLPPPGLEPGSLG